ncbi:hypothetical protein CBD41_00840, partial [bacterium TMED181]
FNEPDFKPFSFNRPGWMEKSFAYVIMKAKDASVDLIPEVRIDLDFEDGTNGSVRIPVVSPVIPIVASTNSTPRPNHGTGKVELTLDDRELDSGTLGMEILADGLGVLPPLDQLVPGWKEAFADSGFQIAEVDGLLDNGLNVTEMHDDLVNSSPLASPIVAKTERSWTLRFARDSSTPVSKNFNFPIVADGSERICKQYTDFDIVTLDKPIAELSLVDSNPSKLWQIIIGLAALFLVVKLFRSPAEKTIAVDHWKIPETLSSLSLLQYLQRIDQENVLQGSELADSLRKDIESVEIEYFSAESASTSQPLDLHQIAQRWRNEIKSDRS